MKKLFLTLCLALFAEMYFCLEAEDRNHFGTMAYTFEAVNANPENNQTACRTSMGKSLECSRWQIYDSGTDKKSSGILSEFDGRGKKELQMHNDL